MYLSVYQSSSPSYVLMAGMEYGISFMERQGQEALARLKERLTDFRKNAAVYPKFMCREKKSSVPLGCGIWMNQKSL